MLKELHVENLALIQQATIHWDQGFNALTGETGAGKSMVIDAMGLLLGGRAQQEYIRAGSEVCLVQGSFGGPFPTEVVNLLAEAGISCEEDLICSRELQRSAKSVCRINLRAVPLSFYRSVISRLVNIHGQMEHMNILEPWCQLNLLDSYGGQPLALAAQKVAACYEVWSQAQKELAAFEKSQADLAAKSDFLRWQLQEIEKAALVVGEEETLKQEQYRLDNAAAIAKSVQAAHDALRGGRNGESTLERVWEAKCQLEKLCRSDASLEQLLQQVNEAYYNLEDAADQINSYGGNIVDDPGRLDWVNQRLAAIRDICRKHGGSVEQALAEADQYRQELDRVDNKDYYGKELTKAAAQAEESFQAAAAALTKLRQQAAQQLGQAITNELQELCMPQAVFSIQLSPAAPSANGVDEAVFMICPNPGEGVRPVAKIASGGEMSRIMLAVKVILAQMDQVPTLIFDEIDSGLGGVALGSVAKKLSEVSHYTQTICVTHAPVMAAYGDNHLLVEKADAAGRTNTSVRRLTPEERVEELCRMLAGENITEATRQQAQELLALRQRTNS